VYRPIGRGRRGPCVSADQRNCVFEPQRRRGACIRRGRRYCGIRASTRVVVYASPESTAIARSACGAADGGSYGRRCAACRVRAANVACICRVLGRLRHRAFIARPRRRRIRATASFGQCGGEHCQPPPAHI
ncbi:hypothetical protein IWW46_000445, partial [Coemansia sp. RSA 2440]